MRTQDIIIGELYRLRTSPDYGYVKAEKVLKKKEGENTTNFTLVKCKHSSDKNFDFCFIRYFRPCDLIKIS